MANSNSLFRVIVKNNPAANKVLFYMTSYKFPWWIYLVPIRRFQKLGYEVLVYEFADAIVESSNPKTLPQATQAIIEDVQKRQQEYQLKNISTFHGIGNSLGGYELFNSALHRPFSAIVLNGGGSIADVIFGAKKGTLARVAKHFLEVKIDHQKLLKYWADFDLPSLGKNTKAEKILITWSTKDGLVPRKSTEDFIEGLKSSGQPVTVKTDSKPHMLSVLFNSLKVKKLYRFLNG